MTNQINFTTVHRSANRIVESFGNQATAHRWKPVAGSLGAFDAAFTESGWPPAPGGLPGHAALTLIAAGGGFLDDIGYLIADARTPGRAVLSLDPLTRSAVEHLSTGLWILAPNIPSATNDAKAEAQRRTRIERAYLHLLDAADHFVTGRDDDPDRAKAHAALTDQLKARVTGKGKGRCLGGTKMATLSGRARLLERLALGSADPGVKEVYAHLSTSSHPNFHALYELNKNAATHFTLPDETIANSYRLAALLFSTAWAEVARYHGWDTAEAEAAKKAVAGLNPGTRSPR